MDLESQSAWETGLQRDFLLEPDEKGWVNRQSRPWCGTSLHKRSWIDPAISTISGSGCLPLSVPPGPFLHSHSYSLHNNKANIPTSLRSHTFECAAANYMSRLKKNQFTENTDIQTESETSPWIYTITINNFTGKVVYMYRYSFNSTLHSVKHLLLQLFKYIHKRPEYTCIDCGQECNKLVMMSR